MLGKTVRYIREIFKSARFALAMSIIMPSVLLALAGWWTYQTAVETARRDAENTADVLYEFSRRALDEQFILLNILRYQIDKENDAETRSSQAFHDRVMALLNFYPHVTNTFIIDKYGDTLFSSLEFPPPEINYSDRDYFIAQSLKDIPIYISERYIGKASGAEVFNISLRRPSVDGSFNGVIVVSMPMAYFNDFFTRVANRRSSSITFIRTDGTVINSTSAATSNLARLPADSTLMQSIGRHDPGTFFATPAPGGRAGLFAYRLLGNYPLAIAYGIDTSAIVAAWWANFVIIAAIAGIAALGLSLTSLAVLRGQAALHRREASLKTEVQRREDAEAQTSRSLEDALRANTAKSEFLAMMSHELRTPLNAIIGFSDLMVSEMFGPLGSERYKIYLADILASGNHLLAVINDILDLSRVDLGRVKPDIGPTDISTILEESIRMVSPIAEKAEITIDSRAVERLPAVHADGRLLKQALLNVLSNAIKFTPRGGRVEVVAKHLTNRTAVIEMSDTGIGMSPEQVALALKPFVQVDNSLSRKYEGAGLGLPLAKAFIELQNAEFAIDSRPGRGTTIRFTFRIAQAQLDRVAS
jgi:signal transduction histidine kinase